MPSSPMIMLKLLWDHPANEGRRLRAVANAVGWQARKRLLNRPRDLTVYSEMTWRAWPDSTQPGRFIYFGGWPDFEEMAFMRRFLRPGDGFIDGGANEGMFTLLAAQLVGPTGEVHAFEAVPRYLERLGDNVDRNGLQQVVIHDTAIGAETGTVLFAVRGTGSRIQTAEDAGETVSATVVRLDDALPDREWAMGKLDLEGAEMLALAGATGRLPAVWMLEIIDRSLRRFGSSEGDVRAWLDNRGYDTVLYDPAANRLIPAPNPIWPLANLMAVRRDQRAEIEKRIA